MGCVTGKGATPVVEEPAPKQETTEPPRQESNDVEVADVAEEMPQEQAQPANMEAESAKEEAKPEPEPEPAKVEESPANEEEPAVEANEE